MRILSLALSLVMVALASCQRVETPGNRPKIATTTSIASQHQRDFCEWLGLKVVASFRAADTAAIAEIDQAITAGKLAQTKLVVANLPEGSRSADALAARLKAHVVVFENFPALRKGRVSYDDMLSSNLEALIKAAAP